MSTVEILALHINRCMSVHVHGPLWTEWTRGGQTNRAVDKGQEGSGALQYSSGQFRAGQFGVMKCIAGVGLCCGV